LQPNGESLVRNELFEIEKWEFGTERELTERGRFAIIVCLMGELECAGRKFGPGEFFLVPAQLEDRRVRAIGKSASLLRVTLPRL